jgi:hypothetical protein
MMNNPQETRTVQGIVRSVELFLRSDTGSKRICVLVEGPDDSRIYSRFFKNVKTNVMVIKSTGKPKTIESLQILLVKTRRAIGICDADFSHLDRNYPVIGNIFLTDYHDIEMTMLSFTDVLHSTWPKFLSQSNAEETLQNVLQGAAYMAYIRWYNQRKQCHLRFKNFEFASCFKVQNGIIEQDNKKIIGTLNHRSINKTELLSIEEIDIFIRTNQTGDTFNLCNGHDVTALLALILEDETKQAVSREGYCVALRESFQLNHFIQTQLYTDLLSWQNTNGFDLLTTDPGAANG